ncbi:hypothetical protein PF002_g2092 [Phytophthora fragariae]|uniref:PBP domain-containing protein n=1 Tax=Phytophthora fragariae TaxID=53985 RepID=A0A6A4AGQ2_9STRA|nr:hypothetical protein PF002_g2092 [Phytophthora fragariae]
MKLFFAPIAAALTLLAAPVLAVEEEVKTLDELTAGSGLPPWPTRASTANNLVTAQDKVIGVGTYAGAPPIVYVGGNGTEYLTWGQRLAILAKAKHPAAAKLFMNWIVSTEVQESVVLETVRTDIAPSGSSHPWEISEANLDAFPLFMSNRAQVEALKQTFALYFGEVQGEPTPGYLGVHPGL